MNFDLVIRNADIATASERFVSDIGIAAGRIAALGERLPKGTREIDASGFLVLPGGVDSHCHIDQRTSQGLVTADDFESGTISAAFGGTTTIMSFAAQHKGQSVRAVVNDYHSRAEGKAIIDYTFHLIISDAGEQTIGQELPALIKDGYTSLKIYMTYEALRLPDRQFLEVLDVAGREGAIAMVHAENHELVDWLTDRLLRDGKTAMRYHAAARPALAENEATNRAITFAEAVGVRILIVHVSSDEAMSTIRRAQDRGVPILAETCPQYLFLTASDLDREAFEGAKYCCTPPPRSSADQAALWRGIANGTFQVISSDHSAFRFDDPKGKKVAGASAPFNRVPQGVPGIEVRLPLLFSEGVMKNRITLQQFVSLTATAPAAIYGLAQRKGTIAIGADADIALWDPTREVTIDIDNLHDRMDYTPYQGMTITGWPTTVLSRGEIVCQDGRLLARSGRGKFLRRAPFSR
ncbi:MAG: dihydropyrimidinase [Alphaproteobacteria bacterium]|nr:dihydropyrimidinase [Alphaproteobacteria bacterium]